MKVMYSGLEYECSEAEGKRLIAAGLAQPIGEQPVEQRETAVKKTPAKETRTLAGRAKQVAKAIIRGEPIED